MNSRHFHGNITLMPHDYSFTEEKIFSVRHVPTSQVLTAGILFLFIVALFICPAWGNTTGPALPPSGFQDKDQDGLNDLFRDADGDGVNDISGRHYSHIFSFKDDDLDRKNDLFQDANGDGINDLFDVLVKNPNTTPIFALDANQDKLNDISGRLVEEEMKLAKPSRDRLKDTFIDDDNDGLDDRRKWGHHRSGRGKGRGQRSGQSNGFSRPAETKRTMTNCGGWHNDSAYWKKFPTAAQASVTGTITSIETVLPLTGMDIGIQLTIENETGLTTVHLGPEWFIARLHLDLTENATVTITGFQCAKKKNPLMIARQIIIQGTTVTLRNSDGALAF